MPMPRRQRPAHPSRFTWPMLLLEPAVPEAALAIFQMAGFGTKPTVRFSNKTLIIRRRPREDSASREHNLGPDEAHEEWPPHWHMHLYWKDVPKVRKVAHFYLSESALLTGDFSSDLKGSSLTERSKGWYPNGVANETRTPSGELVYSQTITAEGYFKLGTANGACLISPISGGFDSGVTVTCDNGTSPVSIRATDDPALEILILYRDGRAETEYRYDTDTGAITATSKLAESVP